MALAQQKFALEREALLLDMEFKREQHRQSMAQTLARGIGRRRRGKSGEAETIDPAPLLTELLATLQRINGPKRVVRDAQGRVSHLEPMPEPGVSPVTPS
jgi:hypothetical protein